MSKFKKENLVNLYAIKANISSAEAERRVNDILEILTNIFKRADKLILRNFGTFTIKMTKREETKHPVTGEIIKIAPRKYVQFKMSKKLLYF